MTPFNSPLQSYSRIVTHERESLSSSKSSRSSGVGTAGRHVFRLLSTRRRFSYLVCSPDIRSPTMYPLRPTGKRLQWAGLQQDEHATGAMP
jgi:hypothetical protein